MIPSALAAQLEQGLRDFLLSSFNATTPGFDSAIQRLLDEPGRLLKGPHLQVSLPFVRGSRADWFPKVPLAFTPHKHQEVAFARLGGSSKKSTLIATGTGSGKSECFLWPILAHCEAHASEPGIKAILIYPMNALATDQAQRVARAIHGNANLKGKVRAGLYIGRGGDFQSSAQMGPDTIITDRDALQKDPPDILLTNYKMLDFLMVRPRDRRLWNGSLSGSLRFLVVDEIHTFDGAQGTDLACLIRRLKARLRVEPGQLCCVGTSATLGGREAGASLRAYAAQVFGEPFDDDAIVGEVRQDQAQFFGDAMITGFHAPGPADAGALALSSYERPADYLEAQAKLWLGDSALEGPPHQEAWRVALGQRLREHVMLRNVLARVSGEPRDIGEVVSELGRAIPAFKQDPTLGRHALVSFLSLVSAARVWRDELPETAAAREARGEAPPTDPFLQVRVQLWQRELRRMVAGLGTTPRLRFFDDLSADERRAHLPVIHCRDCGAMGWSTLHRPPDPSDLRVDLQEFYQGFFASPPHPNVRFLFPVQAFERKGPAIGIERHVDTRSLRAQSQTGQPGSNEIALWEIAQVHDGGTRKDCPFCGARSALTLLGFQAATLTSVYIDQLFSSPWNDDKKLLAFSDSVQDASHRAGFFGARTWRFNIRVALADLLKKRAPLSLAQLAGDFPKSLHDGSKQALAAFVGQFIPPNLEWRADFDALRKDGELPAGSDLPEVIAKRLEWEVYEELSLRSRIGRSFLRCELAAVGVDPDRLAAVLPELLERLRQEVGTLRKLAEDELRKFVLGFLHYLRERGGVLQRLLPDAYLDTAGTKTYVFKVLPYLPNQGPASRLPTLLASHDQGTFDQPESASSWYARWCNGTLAARHVLLDARDVYPIVLDALTKAGILGSAPMNHPPGRCWGLNPEALRVTTSAVRVACERCGHSATVPEGGDEWDGMPCLSARCPGFMRPLPKSPDYFAQLYASGELARIVAAEHTGLLDRGEREEVERNFKRRRDRRPWDPNLLSCTPTLEMGIDIGDLSSVILCSVPPAQANYLQRIGRAGRRDGNSLVLTVANARDHDLYFFEDPNEMMAGEVRPPGLYLDASAVLERQLTAWCFDRWAEQCQSDDALPRRLCDVYPRLAEESGKRFPHDLRAFIVERRTELLDGFKRHFGASLRPESLAHLETFLDGDDASKSGLVWRIFVRLQAEKAQSDEYGRQLRRLKERIDQEKAKPQGNDVKELLGELEREHAALASLRRQVDERDTLNFFTDEGLLPNYAFPEAAVRLRSVVWRKRSKDSEGYETFTYQYDRPGEAALSELAPESTFYAGGRRVKIERIDLQLSDIESWRFCDQCDHAAPEVEGTMGGACPVCGSRVWADAGRVLPLVRLSQVFAGTSDRESRVGDERDERVPSLYLRDTQVTFQDAMRRGAWALGEETEPFGWEYVSSASFREVNFGAQTAFGQSLTVGGRSAVRAGFLICSSCGQLQPRSPNAKHKHAPSCKARNPAAPKNFLECVYLYRAFDSEAVRILLPVVDFASNREIQSLVAGIRTGLRLYFGGRVEHIRMALQTEPVKDSPVRRQYLVLYDAVPGGTGYLAELVRQPQHLFDLLERARQHLVECGCAADTDRDGCYRCVYAYRARYDMADISRRTAISLLSSILGRRTSLKEIQRLSDVSISGLVDSALERRFIEALRRVGTDKNPSTLSQAFVKGKPGWSWKLGSRTWLIEPQKNHAPNDGFGVGLSIDFVFHSAEGVPLGEPAFAVFLDGWQYHAERVGKDMLQRMSAKASGRYVVASFTWDDVARALGEDAPEPASPLLPVERERVAKLVGQWNLGTPPAAILDRTPLQLFAARLAGEVDGRQMRILGASLLLAPVQPLTRADWIGSLESALPVSLWATAAPEPGTNDLMGLSALGDTSFPCARLVAVPRGSVNAEFQAIGEGRGFTALRAAFVLDDCEDAKARQKAWASMLRTANLLSELPGTFLFVARAEAGALDYAALVALLASKPSAASPWDAVRSEIAADFQPLVGALEAEGVLPAGVGVDLPDARGRACGVIAELAWEEARIAVLADDCGEGAKARVAPEWLQFSIGELSPSPDLLLTALRERGGLAA
jgi:DEAD/DEAH box helicase domain-containing protein